MSMYDSRDSFKTYFEHASEKNIVIEMLESRFNPSSTSLSILDLGCHDGTLIQKILDANQDKIPEHVFITGVEPSPEAARAFADKMFSANMQSDIYIGTAEDYFLHHASTQKFDWVLASQCLYWSADLPAIIKNIAAAGKSSLIVLRGYRGIYEIQSQFKMYVGNPDERFYTADDVEAALIQLNISYQRELHSTTIHLPQKGSNEMRSLINFFLQTDEANLSCTAHDEVESWILSRWTEEITHDVYYFWLGHAMYK